MFIRGALEKPTMVTSATVVSGCVSSIWRYPVKSMVGEELETVSVTERGLWGDRAFALIDDESGRIVTAKNPRKWGDLFSFRASLPATADPSGPLPEARITFPDGSTTTSAAPDIHDRLSKHFDRAVRLSASAPQSARAEGYWPDYNWLEQPGEIFEFDLPPGTFFDGATIQFVTTATLNRLKALAPTSRFDVGRFRPNLVIDCVGISDQFIENDWNGRTLQIGSDVKLLVWRPTGRCVMTTLAQGDLPKDPGVLRTVVENNDGNVGAYATVIREGKLKRGDAVTLT